MADSPPGVKIDALRPILDARAESIPGYAPCEPITVELMQGGRSNLSYLVSQSHSRWVLRRPPLGHVMPSAHDMGREFRVLSALTGTAAAAPHTYLFEAESALGAPFMMMEFVPGVTIGDAEAARELSPGQRDALCAGMCDALITLHSLPIDSGPLSELGHPHGYLGRQVQRWTEQWQRTRTRDSQDADHLCAWLVEHLPESPEQDRVGLLHGDFRVDNLRVDPETMKLHGILDWEMSTLGDPIADLAVTLVYWQDPQDEWRRSLPVSLDVTIGQGFWNRERLVDAYRAAFPDTLERLDYCLALACMKLATIMESIHFRFLAGQTVDELSAGLGEAVPALLATGLRVAEGQGLRALSG